MSAQDQQLVKGTMTILVLSFLSARPMHGYGLVRALEEAARGHISFKEGTVYPLLYSLEERRLIQGEWTQGDSGRPRKNYRVTVKGKKVLERQLALWKQVVKGMELVLECR